MDSNNKKINHDRPVVGITIGDINGVGPEVIIKALSDSRILEHMTPVIFGSTKVLSFYRKMYQVEDFQYSQLKSFDRLNHRKINVMNCWPEMVEIKVGQVTEAAGNCAYLALKEAVKQLKENKIDALVTAPINKKNIRRDDFNFPGHTEYLTSEFGAKDSLMLLVAEQVRVGVVTGHIPLKEVAGMLSIKLIERKLKILLSSLKNDFGILKPKVAVMGLNPHAGEEGLFGEEEQEFIEPVIKTFKNKGNLVYGPFPADGFFGALHYRKFDAILAMYHDQGLIPFKMAVFDKGVNFTAGLPIIRTSPDHGTGYSIAGKNEASPHSMREALYLAANIVKVRKLTE